MTKSTNQARRSEGGFTLVELAIVMIIIGLLIGGILKGQELIENARVSSTVAQIKAIESGVSGFRDKYAGFPGDIGNPNNRLPNCAAALCSNAGNGDSRVQTGTANDPGAATGAGEAAATFVQMAVTGFIGGVQSTANAVGAGSVPPTPLGGFWNFGYSAGGAVPTGGLAAAAAVIAGHYVSADLTPGAQAGTGVVFKPSQAATIDTKLDDGLIGTGSVFGIGAACGGAAPSGYAELTTAVSCSVFAKVQ